jgi:site-specific recombinase XerD
MFLKSLIAQGAAVPKRIPVCITREEIESIVVDMPSRLAGILLIMWKAAARYSETAALTRSRFIHLSPDEVTLDWGQGTKSSRLAPFRPDRFTVIKGWGTDRICQVVKRLKPDEPLSRMPASSFAKTLSNYAGRKMGTHAVKHGAVHHLMENVVKGAITMSDVQCLAKHKSIETTIRYAGANRTTANALGTARATNVL